MIASTPLPISDLASACLCALTLLFALGALMVGALSGASASDFTESDDTGAETPPDLSECGIAEHIPTLPAGSQLVEAGDGMITTPDRAFLYEYRWTGSQVEYVRRVPLSDFVRRAISHPDALQAEADFFTNARRMTDAQRAESTL